MPNLTQLLQHSAIYGAILSALMSLLFIGIAYLNPEIWLKDYPPDIQQKFGPMSEKAQEQKYIAYSWNKIQNRDLCLTICIK